MEDRPARAHQVYLRPVGLVPASADSRASVSSQAGYSGTLPLCGDGPFDFTAVEIITRAASGPSRRLRMLGELWASDPLPELQGADEILGRLTSPRRRIAGVAMTSPQIMGVVNVTPDSFSDGGQLGTAEAAIAHALQLVHDGATILDIGGESTRPGSDAVPLADELARVLPVIAGLAGKTDALISIDTRKADVAARALAAGAHMVNDVSALTYDPQLAQVIAQAGVPVILMHAAGDPKTMQLDPHYDDAPLDIYDYLAGRIQACLAAGISRDKIIVDPGIGFGKTLAHNLELMAALALFHGLGCPVLLGASRKRFIGTLTHEPVAAQRVAGSVGAALAAAAQGVQIIRVHDVRQTKAALDVYWASISGKTTQPR